MTWNFSRRRLGRDLAKNWDEDPGMRPRVLLESPDGAEAYATWKTLRRHGFQTLWCPGPQDHAAECPLTADGHCQLVEQSDCIVSALDLQHNACRAVVRDLNTVATETPVVILAPPATTARWQDELPNCHVTAGRLDRKALLHSVELARSGVVSALPSA